MDLMSCLLRSTISIASNEPVQVNGTCTLVGQVKIRNLSFVVVEDRYVGRLNVLMNDLYDCHFM